MIIIKTTKGDAFVNENNIHIVQHDREHRQAVIRSANDDLSTLNDVDAIIYTNETYTTATESNTNSQPDYYSDSIEKLREEMDRLEYETNWLHHVSGCGCRLISACRRNKINTIGELLAKGRGRILIMEGMGRKSIELADTALKNLYGIKTW